MDDLRALTIDVRKAMEQLPPELRRLCRRLETETVIEMSRDTGIPRGTIYKSIKKLRALFEDAGPSIVECGLRIADCGLRKRPPI